MNDERPCVNIFGTILVTSWSFVLFACFFLITFSSMCELENIIKSWFLWNIILHDLFEQKKNFHLRCSFCLLYPINWKMIHFCFLHDGKKDERKKHSIQSSWDNRQTWALHKTKHLCGTCSKYKFTQVHFFFFSFFYCLCECNNIGT
jgi:hypothetical protein